MKKYYKFLGFIVLSIVSFYYTSKTSMAIRNIDDIMVSIKDVSVNEKLDYVNAYVDGDKVVPGLSGYEIDVSKSYDAMKKVGIYSKNLLVYKTIKPEISVDKIYDKYISYGNPNKNEVSLIFKIDMKDDIDFLVNILEKYEVKANFYAIDFIDDRIYKIKDKGHIILLDDAFKNNIFKSKYCYLEEDNKDILNLCSMHKYHTIIPSIISSKTPTLIIKKEIKNGSIISIDINSKTIKEIEYIIRFIKSKGFDIVTLEKLLEE